jgi:tRNA threonylcarbamoyl adenosine modification protein (Sua5/YciO/YrdC/YwlC family)
MPARILQPSQLDEAVRLLSQGALVAFPTDTVYGVAALADAEFDNGKLRAFKAARGEKFSLHAGSVSSALRFVGELPRAEYYPLQRLTPRGVTVVIARDSTSLGVRVVQHELGSALLEQTGAPIVATSANAHGQPPLRDPSEIVKLPVDAVLDGGVLPERPSSTVVRLLPCGLEVLRTGTVSAAELADIYTAPIHFICLGNLNRSAFAHRWIDAMQSWLKVRVDGFVPRYSPHSSGLIAHPRTRPPADMLAAADERGVDLRSHLPKPFEPGVFPGVCVSMGAEVTERIRGGTREAILLWQIHDPMGGTPDEYRRAVAQVIEHARRDLLARWADVGELRIEFEKLFCGERGQP